MGSTFVLEARRAVSAAGKNIYMSPVLHPDRIMDEHDLIYLIAGAWEVCQNGERFMMHPGDVLILHAGQHHYGVCPCEENTQTFYIHMQNYEGDLYVTDGVAGIGALVHCQSHPQIRDLFASITELFWQKGDANRARLSALCTLLLCDLCECHPPGEADSRTMLENALRILGREPNRFFRLRELADMLYVSDKTLRNAFVRAYQKTPRQYQLDRKMHEARMFLENYPAMTLEMIAESLGFYDAFHFSRTFMKLYGVSPSSYRKSTANNKRPF